MPAIPRDRRFDCSRAYLADPYGFISKACREHGTDLFETRILLRRTICMYGRWAAELFYDPDRFLRRGGAPEPVRATLFGKGGVQGLDGAAHRQRKALFLFLQEPEAIDSLVQTTADVWRRRARGWYGPGQTALYPALQEVLTRAVCHWAGVPLPEAEVPGRTRQLAALFDQAAAPGLGHLHARLARLEAERWLAQLVREMRRGKRLAPAGSALQAVAGHLDEKGRPLPPRLAAVELLNILRPTVAVSVYMVFVAHALHLEPRCRRSLEEGDPAYLDWFVQEVRRLYPFFPAVAARVRQDFMWEGYRFPRGRRVMLDLYATNHDSRAWDEPDIFRPERFREQAPTRFDLVPQGGGDVAAGHRCPGEGITIGLMKMTVDFLLRQLRYEVPAQDLIIDYSRLPAIPRDGFLIRRARLQWTASGHDGLAAPGGSW